MKKATSKRERKYGKKVDDVEEKPNPTKKVKVMVDGYTILQFKDEVQANEYINKKTKEAQTKNRPAASFIIL